MSPNSTTQELLDTVTFIRKTIKEFKQLKVDPKTIALQEENLRELLKDNPELNISSTQCEEALDRIIGESSLIQSVKTEVRTLTNLPDSVLITGESGTGKELIAKALHGYRSTEVVGNNVAQFIDINCAAISEDLFESELFGHEKGSFTGAHESRIGKMEAAYRGTLFLDEIGDMPLSMQSKLLRALQERKITRVGSNKNINIDFRLICATNKNLEQDVKERKFRLDLYYRIATFEIKSPALRDRRSDIPRLIQYFSKGLLNPPYTAEMQKYIETEEFLGNIRELERMVRRMIILKRI